VRFRLEHYVRRAAEQVPGLKRKRVSPHTFRHSMGVAVVAAGVDITVTHSWLGHVSLDMTNHYARANLETKPQAVEQVDKSTRSAKPPCRKRDPDVLTRLNSL
jgi:integrase/recombinase XerC